MHEHFVDKTVHFIVCGASINELDEDARASFIEFPAKVPPVCLPRAALIRLVLKSAQRAEEDAAEKFDILLQCIEAKKAELVSAIQEERNMKQSALKDQIHQCISKLTRSTGLIQFCIEMLKESDSLAFILVAQSLINRALNAEQAFMHEIEQPPVVLEYTCSPPTTTGSTLWPKGRPVANSSFLSLMETEAVHKAIADLSLHEGVEFLLLLHPILFFSFRLLLTPN
ncbi:unnamed protein product [Dibothriocephalus latus]|uniref:Uncharacterized protein n=1 Tax=Dibothriocephalus latus TaxID=60516 RepID=A0A3P6U890_DIBLA|nr:unnamed protein product [Dibothriocephalus latus]